MTTVSPLSSMFITSSLLASSKDCLASVPFGRPNCKPSFSFLWFNASFVRTDIRWCSISETRLHLRIQAVIQKITVIYTIYMNPQGHTFTQKGHYFGQGTTKPGNICYNNFITFFHSVQHTEQSRLTLLSFSVYYISDPFTDFQTIC